LTRFPSNANQQVAFAKVRLNSSLIGDGKAGCGCLSERAALGGCFALKTTPYNPYNRHERTWPAGNYAGSAISWLGRNLPWRIFAIAGTSTPTRQASPERTVSPSGRLCHDGA